MPGKLVRMLQRDRQWRRTAEWDHPSQHLIKDHSQTVDVRSWRQVQSATLFRRHVTRSAKHCANLRERVWLVFVEMFRTKFGDTEVEYLDDRGNVGTLSYQDIRWL